MLLNNNSNNNNPNNDANIINNNNIDILYLSWSVSIKYMENIVKCAKNKTTRKKNEIGRKMRWEF